MRISTTMGGTTVRPCTFPNPKQRPVLSIRCTVETVSQKPRLGNKWKEYQGINNWEGLLDPLDDTLCGEILRYGKFVGSTYSSFNSDPSSSSYATCRFPKQSLLDNCGLTGTGYRLTKNLHATSGTQLPRFFENKFPSWVSKESSWIGYVAVCQDEEEISRLGRRDVVIAYRGTATCLEWLENLRSKLTQIPNATSDMSPPGIGLGPMVESGFQSLYTSSTATCRSLQEEVREEISRLLQSYGDEPISLTITGHSLGAALATLTAYDISTTFDHPASVTVISFGGPRVGNRSFRHEVEKCGTKVLRIVNSDDIVTKVPGFLFKDDMDDDEDADVSHPVGTIPRWIQKRVKDTEWMYADVGHELRLSTRDSPILNGRKANIATCHELDTYLHLVNCSKTSACPLKSAAKRMLTAVG